MPQISPIYSSQDAIDSQSCRGLVFLVDPLHPQRMSLHRLHEPQVGKHEPWNEPKMITNIYIECHLWKLGNQTIYMLVVPPNQARRGGGGGVL